MTWQGWRISTTVTVAVVAVALIAFAATIAWSAFRFFIAAPGSVSIFFRERRRARGWRAISRGMIAVGAGNLKLARNSANEAQKILGHEPLALLLAAQAAQLDGDSVRAEAEFRAMLVQPETRLLGLRGLYLEARRRNDLLAARAAATEASAADVNILWASEALIEFQNLAGEWDKALETVTREANAKTIDKPTAKRRRAVLLTAQALTVEHSDSEKAIVLAREAVKLAPALVPAAALAAKLEARGGSARKASRILEKAWAQFPHPELADAYLEIGQKKSGADRLRRVRNLTKKTPAHPEAALAVARTAIDAHEYAAAREALAPHIAEPTQATYLMMAEIEVAEHSDHGKAREWTARAVRAARDPAWVADGYVSEKWLPASPLTGRLDAFEWRVPPASNAGPILEHMVEQSFARSAAPAPSQPPALKPSEDILLVPDDARPRVQTQRPAAIPPVIAEPPLPDDPGPEPEDAAPEGKSSARGWLGGSA